MTLTTRQTFLQNTFEAHQREFLAEYPRYASTAHLDELRQTEYKRLDDTAQVYLDYTGGGLYAASQLEAHMKMMAEGVWGNPHSHNPTSQAMTDRVEAARAYVLQYFNADPAEYDVVFTPNASGALKLVGESYPFTDASRYLLIFDNHNSVNGIREFARARGANVTYVPTELPDLRLNPAAMRGHLAEINREAFNLFAYPAQSNFSGVQHDLSWIEEAQAYGWHVFLDAAAYAPTNRLDLSQHQPDFVSLSFYKMFGYPTGIGALVAKREALQCLQRPWFAGGTITITSVQGAGWHYLIDGHAAFEDGTVNYLSIPAVEIGLKHLEKVGIDAVHERVACLTGWLLGQMSAITHDNGMPMVKIYGPQQKTMRGGTISFNLQDPEGKPLDFRRVEMLANQANISLRTGCFCNPGTGELVHHLTQNEMAQVFDKETALSFDEFVDLAATEYDKFPSTIRVSVGIASNFADVFALMAFLEGLKNRPASEINSITVGQRKMVDTA